MAPPAFRTVIVAFLLLASIGISLPLIGGFLGELHPALDSFGHFRWHLGLMLLAAGLLLLPTRLRLNGVLSVGLAAGSLWTTLPGMGIAGNRLQPAQANQAEPVAQPVYRLLHLNLRYNNDETAAVLSLVGRTKPDVVALNEVSDRWRPRLAPLAAMYPYQTMCMGYRGVGGVAILSRRPLAAGQTVRCLQDGAMAVGRFDFGGRWVDIVAIHLQWPWPFGQARQVADMAQPLGDLPPATIIAGDFNATTWSRTVSAIAEASATQVVTGIGATWLMTGLPRAVVNWAGLPIDNIFSGAAVEVLSAERQGDVGSDHLPILVSFSVPGDNGDGQATVASSY